MSAKPLSIAIVATCAAALFTAYASDLMPLGAAATAARDASSVPVLAAVQGDAVAWQASVEPESQRTLRLDGEALPLAGAEITISTGLRDEFPVTVRRLREQLGDRTESGVKISAAVVPVAQLPAALRALGGNAEAFHLRVDAESRAITVSAPTQAGLQQGISRLLTLARAGNNTLRSGELVDWPEHPIRALHITTRDVNGRMIRRVVDQAADAGFNTLIMQYADSVAFDAAAVVPRRNAMSKKQFVQAVQYIRDSGLHFIPEVKLLSHQEKFLGDAHPDLMYNKITYDPRNPRVYELVEEYLEELIELVDPDVIHIGHDEIRGFDQQQRDHYFNPGEELLPAELFLADVKRLHEFLRAREIETWMWGDVLITKAEFPRMKPRHLHGNADYAALRPQLPKDIVICDWHYKDVDDFSSTAAFASEGFRVLGATWKTEPSTRAFSRAVAAMEPPAAGMIATSWWHLRRKEWDMMDSIIADSGDAFWYAR